MLKIVTTILCVYMLVRCVLPLRCKRPLKILLALLVLLVGFRLHIFSLLYATFNPELPRWVLVSTGVPHVLFFLLALLSLLRDGVCLIWWLARRLRPGLPALPGSNRQMTALLQGADLCVDATHPYAVEATRNIRAACKTAGTEYRRLLRPESPLPAGSMVFASAAHAAGFLARTQGNVLLATGAKELSAFAVLEPARLFPRVLPTREGIAACEGADIPHKNIIAMQGPFSYALNRALMEQFAIRFLVTKDGGAAGGFEEKARAAQDTGAQLIVIRRPAEQGETAEQILTHCKEMLQ